MYLAQTFSSTLHTYLYTHVFHFLQLTLSLSWSTIHLTKLCSHGQKQYVSFTVCTLQQQPIALLVYKELVEEKCAHFSADPVPSQEWRPQSLDLQEDMRKLLRIFMAVPPLCLRERESNTFLVSRSLH